MPGGVQGGTCIFTGDEALLLEQAAEIAAQTLQCSAAFGAAPLFRDGYSRARSGALDADARCVSTVLCERGLGCLRPHWEGYSRARLGSPDTNPRCAFALLQ